MISVIITLSIKKEKHDEVSLWQDAIAKLSIFASGPSMVSGNASMAGSKEGWLFSQARI